MADMNRIANAPEVVQERKLAARLNSLGLLLVLFLVGLVLTLLSPRFLSVDNLMNVASQAAINSIVSIGMFMTILTAGIDLSVGSVLALSTMFMALLSRKLGLDPYLSMGACLIMGALLGLVNGLMLTKLNLPHPFISTLGMMNIGRGLALILTAAAPISLFPQPIQFLGNSFAGPVPVSFILAAILYVLVHLFLTRTTAGRYIYAVGGNKEASRLSGINVNAILNTVYTVSGFTAALAGLVLVGRVNAAYPLAGQGYELNAIAAVIIGGASFFGGVGSIGNILIGVLFIATLQNGMNLLNVDSNFQSVVIGALIIIAVALDVLRQRAMKAR